MPASERGAGPLLARIGIAAALVLAVVAAVLVLSTAGGGDDNEETDFAQADGEVTPQPADEAGSVSSSGDAATPTPAQPPPAPPGENATEVPSAAVEEGPTSPPTSAPGDAPGGGVLAATEVCGGWAEFSDTFVDLMGGDFLGEPDDPEAAYEYFRAAMHHLAELSPTEELRDAHLVLASATLREFTGQEAEVDPRLDAASALLDEELTGLCPGV
jgi:hypothetical protein